ncbi:MAG: ABC transporter permease [Mogibacterium sp.]|nr:ABC transporter permease [Mogibacterium sp.]
MSRMKWVDLLTTIRVTWVSFIALILFVGLSVGTLLGTGWTGPASAITANRYYDKQAVMDLKAVSADGFDEAMIDRIRAIDDVSAAEGIYTADAFMRINGERELFSVISVTDDIDRLEIIDGTLPQAPDEIAIDRKMAEDRYYSLGDVISLDSSLEELTGYPVSSLGSSRFRITAIVQHPEFISSAEGSAKGYSAAYRRNFRYYAMVDESAFNDDVYSGKYNAVLMRIKSLEGVDRFAAGYSSKVLDAEDRITGALGDEDSISLTDITSTFGYYSVKMAGDTGGKVASVFSSFFFIVGLLVCYSTILRIVEEEKRLIGTKMANGFSRGAVTSKYLMFVTCAVTLGVILGISIAFMISRMSQQTLHSTLTFADTYDYYDMQQILIVVAVEYAFMLLIAWFASAKQLRMKIASLLNNSKENSRLFQAIGKSALVRKASVSIQSFVYNISMDSSRVIATIVGIACSMALLIAPTSLIFNMIATPELQYDELFHFDHTVQYSDDESEEKVISILDEAGAKYAKVYSEDALLSRSGKETGSVRLIVTDDPESFKTMVNFQDPDTHDEIELSDKGVMVWQAEGKDYGAAAGDVMKITSYNGDNYRFEVDGLYRCYDSGSYRLFMTSDVYERVTGKEYKPNAFLTAISDDTANELTDIDGVLSCTDDHKACVDFYNNLKVIYAGVLGLVLMLSAIIAFLILLNLNIQFVKEKKMELIVMRINGFSVGAARMYILRDNIFLTIISTIIGVIAGIILGGTLNSALQLEGQCMISTPSLPGCMFGVAVTLIYVVITNIIAVWPIGKLDLTDISKA